ncbi:MAG: contractile injection system tape measure protein [Cellvibrionaceae bacterium]|nr:contractile injection system tape measure protein [Cellvibrionaceae bacterium]
MSFFPTPLSKPLAMHLFKSAESSQGLDGLTEEQIAGFKSAINQCLSESLSERHKNHRVSASEEKNDQLREWQNRIFSALLPAQTLHLSKYAELKNLASIPREKLPSAINQLLVRSPDRLSTFVREHIDHQSIREYWIDILPESSLVRFIWLLEPQQLRSLLNSAETLSISHLQTNSSRSEGRRELWSFLLEFFADHSGSNCTLSALNASFFKQFPPGREASNGSIRNKNASSVAVHPRPKTDKTYQLASDEDKDQLLSPLNESQPTVLVGREEKKVMHPAMRSRFKLKDSSGTTRIEDCLYIDNAGLVLVGVFLPHLFKSLNMLHTNADGKIRLRDKATFSRGVHILQYLVTGSSSTPEPLLALNKIMCGESIHASVEPRIELAEEELRMCEQLQRAVLANWTSLSNTSITGLQETFFQREGRLVQMDDGWKLTVQRKTVDILMDQVSWSFSVISQAWMPETLYVSW